MITRQLMQNNYDAAMRDAATNANFTAQIQGVKDMIIAEENGALLICQKAEEQRIKEFTNNLLNT